MKLDTQFTGGVILRYTYTGKADTGQIQKEVEDIVDRSVSVQTSENSATGEKSLVITLSGKKGLTPEQQKEILNTINQGNKNQFETSETSAVEPYIGAKALKNSAIAIVLSFLFIVVYIRLRFSALGGLASGVTAVIALVHDILIVLFIFGIFRIPVNDAFVAVTLTIIGYSINDTIVLYDRIREHRSNMKKKSTLAELVDISTTETLQRSINTAFTVVLCAFIIFVVSVVYRMESITNFSLPLLAGLISGCYSSICIAGPLWVWWEEHREKNSEKKDRAKKKMKKINMFLRNQPPGRMIVAGFAAVILLGMLVLLLPISVKDGAEVTLIDALFTSTSAVCVTGLIAIDTADHFTAFGQGVVAALIQVGGLGVTSLGVGLMLVARKTSWNLKSRMMVKRR